MGHIYHQLGNILQLPFSAGFCAFLQAGHPVSLGCSFLYFYPRGCLNCFYLATQIRGHNGEMWEVFISLTDDMKAALKVEGSGTHLKTSIHLSAASPLKPQERENSVLPHPVIGAGVLQSSPLRAPMIYKQTLVPHRLWSFLFTYIRRILTAPVCIALQSHRFLFVYWEFLCCWGV